MRKDQKGFSAIEALLVILAVGVIGFIGWYVYSHKNTKTSSSPSASQTQNTSVLNAPLGTVAQTLKPGESIKLISGPVIQIAGQPATEPLEFFDSKTAVKEASTIPFTSKLSLFHKGYTYDISNQGCKTTIENFGDYTSPVISSCALQITTRKTTAPVIDTAKLSKQFIVTEKGSPPSQTISTAPLLNVEPTPNTRVTLPTNGGNPYMEPPTFDIALVTNYGIKNVSYDVNALYSKQTKEVDIGNAKITVNVDSITCTSTYMGQNGCDIVLDKFIFTVDYANSPGNKYDFLLISKD